MPRRYSVTVGDGMKAAFQPSLACLFSRASAARPAISQTATGTNHKGKFKMNRQKSFKPAIRRFDQFDQDVELRRLGEFADQVSMPEVREYVNNNLVCVNQAAWDHIHTKFTKYIIGSTILKLIDADLLRFGTAVGRCSLKQGFGVGQLSEAALEYIHRRILPEDYVVGALLILLSHGCLLLEIEEHRGEPDFVFGRVWDRIGTARRIIEELPSECALEAHALRESKRLPS
jgi:hypothetical protein